MPENNKESGLVKLFAIHNITLRHEVDANENNILVLAGNTFEVSKERSIEILAVESGWAKGEKVARLATNAD